VDEKKVLKIIRDMGVSLNATLSFTEMQKTILESLTSLEPVQAACIHIYNSDLHQIAFESGQGFSYDDLSFLRDSVQQKEISEKLKKGQSFNHTITPSGLYINVFPCVFLGETLGAIIAGSATEKLPINVVYACELTSARTSSILKHLRHEDSLKQVNRDLEKANTKLKVSEERHRVVVEDQVDFICRFSPSLEINFANISFRRFFGFDQVSIEGTSFISFIHTEDRPMFLSHIQSLRASGSAVISYRVVSGNGSIRWVEWTDRAISSDGCTITEYQSVGRDITERRELEDRLRYMSMHDSLTGLYNRAYFDEQMKRYSDPRFIPVGIIVVDLNALKIVNDAIGHQQGDNLLLASADVLTSCFRASDTIARIGGDEFSVLLPNTDEKTCRTIIDRVRHTIQIGREKNPDTPLSIAIGYAIRMRKSSRMEEVFSEADDMMYREKENQRDFARGLVLTSLVREIEKIDPYRGQHMIRVQNYSMALGDQLGLSQWEKGKLSLASRYHDIGMIGIEKNLTNGTGVFSPEDFEAMQRHAEIGARIAAAHPFLNDLADLILYHHERWDGSGYPSHLKGDTIPQVSRIIAICDSFDSMVYHTSYHTAVPLNSALSEIESKSGILFDPFLVTRFSALVRSGAITVKTNG
jgi:diguanylate cyclase (GGDEF)-like protein/PAS domain S-box-containing protein